MKMRWVFLVVMFVVAAIAGAQVLTQGWTSLRVGAGHDGTAINLIECHSLSFVAATEVTADSDAGSTYYIADGWKDSTADHGKVVISITDGTLTATTATATTGVLTVLVFGAP